MKRHVVSSAFVLGVIFAASTVMRADYRDSFRKAVQASNRGNWNEAVRYFKQAILEGGTETGERIVISGMDTTPYLPHYYYGIALQNTNDCIGALAQWNLSDSQGAVKRTSEFEKLGGRRASCDNRIARTTQSAPPPTRGSSPSSQARPADINALESARSVTKADSEFEEGSKRPPPDLLTQPATTAENTSEPFAGDRQPANTSLEDLLRKAAAPEPSPASVLSVPTRLTGTAIAASPRLEKVVVTPGSPATGRANAPQVLLPRELIRAAQQLFSAHYAEALGSLAPVGYSSGPAGAQVHLFRAAALYSLYLIDGERDKDRLREAENSVRLCQQADSHVQPDKRAFSPRFVQFFTATLE